MTDRSNDDQYYDDDEPLFHVDPVDDGGVMITYPYCLRLVVISVVTVITFFVLHGCFG